MAAAAHPAIPRGYPQIVNERRPQRYDPDERFALDADPEDVLRRLLNPDDPPPDEDKPAGEDQTV